MRKTNVFIAVTTAALAAAGMSVPATESKAKTDAYLIVDLAKVSEPVEETVTEAESLAEIGENELAIESSAEELLTNFYLDLSYLEDTGSYTVNGMFAEEPIMAQFLSQVESLDGYDAAGIYEITSDQTQDLDEYQLNLVLADDANLFHYSLSDGTLVKTPLEAVFGPEQEKTVTVSSSSNHWAVIHFRADKGIQAAVNVAVGTTDDGKASESMEGKVDASDSASAEGSKEVETTGTTEKSTEKGTSTKPTTTPSTTKTPETTKAPDTKPASKPTTKPTTAPTKAPETTKKPETKPASKPTTAPTTSATTTAAPTKAPETTATTKAPETTAPTTTAHTHNWVAVTKIVHHDAVTSQVWKEDTAAWDETVVTKAAWDEQVLSQAAYDEQVLVSEAYDEPVYGRVDICNNCGHEFWDPSDDINEHMAAGCWSGWHTEPRQIGTTHHDAVYNTVHHDAVYTTVHHDAETTVVHHEATGHYETVVTQAAWDETVTTGYKCSGCGATK